MNVEYSNKNWIILQEYKTILKKTVIIDDF